MSFITDHFSRYAIGAPRWSTLTDGFKVKKRWGRYDPKMGTKEAGVGIQGNISGNVRLLIDIDADGVHLNNNTDTMTDGTPLIDMTLNERGQFDTELLFSISEQETLDSNGAHVPSTLNFDFGVKVLSKRPKK